MSLFRRTAMIAPALAALLLAGCGGGGDSTSTQKASQQGQGIAVGEPNGGVPVASEFVKMAQAEPCSDIQSRLFLIDNKQVYFVRQGNCPDASYSRRLLGATPDAVLCKVEDSIAGPQTFCANDSARALFETIEKNRDKPDLGLAAAGHKVEQIELPAKTGAVIKTLFKESFSGVEQPRNVVIKDRAAFEKLWGEHYSRQFQLPPLPQVDFNSQMVVGVFTGGEVSGCGGMAISRVTPKLGKLVVEYEIASPPQDAVCLAVVTQPAHLIVVERSDAQVEFVAVKTARMLAVSVDRYNHSGISLARDVVVKDSEAWATLWAEHAGKAEALPKVDFTTQMVVGSFLGMRSGGCYSTMIDSVTNDGKQITVRRTDMVPGPTVLCTKDIVTPAHLVTIDRSDLPVVFAKEEKQL